MVNNPKVPPTGPGATPAQPVEPTQHKKSKGFTYKEGHAFLGMQFTGDEWTKLMNIMMQSVCDQIKKEQAKAIKAIKKLRKTEQGQDAGDDD
jgi:hypothetical protein